METRLAEKISPYFKFFNEMSLFMHSATLFSSIHYRSKSNVDHETTATCMEMGMDCC